MSDQPESSPKMLALAYSAGSTLTGPMFLGLIADWLAGALPWFTIVGVGLGMLGVFVLLIRMTTPNEPKS